MNTELFIAKRFVKSQKGNRKYTVPIIRLSVMAIALSLVVLIISVSVVTGFKKEIRNRIIGFGGHIQILNFDSNNSYESTPINSEQDFLDELRSNREIKSIQSFATKPALLKTKQENQGVIFKGIASDFDTTFFHENLVEGRMIFINDSVKTNDILISRRLSKLIDLKLGDKVTAYFVDERTPERPTNRRALTVCGIYETSLEKFDEQYIIGDIGHIKTLNGWTNNQIGGFEILIQDYNKLNEIAEEIRNLAEYRFQDDNSRLIVEDIRNKHPQIFDWLNLLDMNVVVILLIMAFVSVINMVSCVIILILDKTPSIGLLKAIGTSNQSVFRIFLYQAVYLVIKGMFLGNLVAFVLLFLQDKFHIIKLDKSSYFIEYAPVNFNFIHLMIINISALLLVFLFITLPTLIVMRIQPVKTLRYN